MIDLNKKKRLVDGLRALFQEILLEPEERSRYLIDFVYGAFRYELGVDEARSAIARLVDDAEAQRVSRDQFDS